MEKEEREREACQQKKGHSEQTKWKDSGQFEKYENKHKEAGADPFKKMPDRKV